MSRKDSEGREAMLHFLTVAQVSEPWHRPPACECFFRAVAQVSDRHSCVATDLRSTYSSGVTQPSGVVDVTGTYQDQSGNGPQAPLRPNFRVADPSGVKYRLYLCIVNAVTESPCSPHARRISASKVLRDCARR